MASPITDYNNVSHKLVNLAYKVKTDNKEKFVSEVKKTQAELANTGWKLLASSSDQDNTNQYGYKAVAFCNDDTKEILIASAGTKADGYDLYDDLLISFGYIPTKLAPLKEFVSDIIEKLGGLEAAKEYLFNTSGHSLGAIVADLTAVELHSKGLEIGKSTTFDSPGSASVVKYAIEQNLFSNKVTTPLEELAKYSEVYNAKPNFINTTNVHAGEVKLVLPREKIVPCEVEEEVSTGIWGFAKYLSNALGSVATVCSNFLGLNKVVEQINEHKLANFENLDHADIYGVEVWNNYDQVILNSNDPKVQELKSKKSTGDDVAIIEDFYISREEDMSSLMMINLNQFAYQDLRSESELIGTHLVSIF